jgi:hypothetical protein
LNRRRVPSPHQCNDHTKPKTKANATRVPYRDKLPYRDNTHSSEVVRIFTAMFICALLGTMPYIVWAEQNTHLLHCVCTCEQTALLRVCYDGKLVNQQRNGYAQRTVAAMDDNY